MIRYRDIFAAKNSDLAQAIEKGDKAAAKRIYEATTRRYQAMHSAEDRVWFAAKAKGD